MEEVSDEQPRVARPPTRLCEPPAQLRPRVAQRSAYETTARRLRRVSRRSASGALSVITLPATAGVRSQLLRNDRDLTPCCCVRGGFRRARRSRHARVRALLLSRGRL